MNTEDVLVKFALEIERATRLLVGGQKLPSMECIVKLAAEVRVLRKQAAFEKAKRQHFVDDALAVTIEQDAEAQTQRKTIRELQTRVAELEGQVKRWEDFFAVTEEAAEDCRTGVPLLTHEQVFGVAPVPNETDGLPKEET